MQGNPIADVSVAVLDSRGNLLLSTATSFSGAFTLVGLPSGTFAVQATAEGYTPSLQGGVVLQGGPNPTR